MRRAAIHRNLAAVLVLALVPIQQSRAADAPATQTDLPQLVPCLAVAADGSPVWINTDYPSSKRIMAAFRLKPNESANTLGAKWVALGEGNKVVAENNLELKGQKTGWLALELKEPAPPGKYRLEATLDGKPWQSTDIGVTPLIEQGKAEKPSDLFPLTEGTTMTYDLYVRSGKDTKVEIPGVKPDADGASRAVLTLAVGKTDEFGTRYQGSINDQPMGESWVKVTGQGLVKVRAQNGDKAEDINPPEVVQSLPPKLEDCIEWSAKSKEGNEQQLQMFGPLPMRDPNGNIVAGYLIHSVESSAVGGSPGTPAQRSKETIDRAYIPKIGLVKEIHIATLNGEFTSRQEIMLRSGLPYRLVADPQMKGRLGRVQFVYPPDTKFSEARVAVYKAGGKDDKAVAQGYGDATFEIMPGKYEVAMNRKRVPAEVKSGNSTILRCGVLRVHAGGETRFHIYEPDRKTELFSGYGEQDVALPIGSYLLDIGGASEAVKIEDGKVTEF